MSFVPNELRGHLPPETLAYLDGDSVIELGGELAHRITVLAAMKFEADTQHEHLSSPVPLKGVSSPIQRPDFDLYYLAKASEEETVEFKVLLGVTLSTDGEILPGPMSVMLGLPAEGFDDEVLASGETLSGAEQSAIHAYTTNNYLLVNGTLDNDATSINMWHEKFPLRFMEMLFNRSLLIAQENLEAATVKGDAGEIETAQTYRQHVTEQYEALRGYTKEHPGFRRDLQYFARSIAYMAASGINKLPNFEGLLFRGEAISLETLKAWKASPPIMITHKFCSCSTQLDTCEEFARDSAGDYMEDLKEPYVPVINIFQSRTSHNIADYSANPHEDERVYVPGAAFQLVGLDEEIVPGLVIGFWKECV